MILLLNLPAFAADTANATQKTNLTVLADEGMLLPLAQLARAYATSTGTPLTVVLKNTLDAEHQIEQGLEAHAIISANYPLIERLSEQGLTDVTSRRAIARTQLALVNATGLSKQAQLAKRISFAAMLSATPDLPVYMSSAGSADGDRAQALLSGHPFSAMLSARAQSKANREEVVEALRDGDSLALLLATDASAERDLNVLALLPEELAPAATYDAVVLGGESMEEAKGFVQFLASQPAQEILSHFGFQAPVR